MGLRIGGWGPGFVLKSFRKRSAVGVVPFGQDRYVIAVVPFLAVPPGRDVHLAPGELLDQRIEQQIVRENGAVELQTRRDLVDDVFNRFLRRFRRIGIGNRIYHRLAA